jgi:chromosome segregation ATPase
MPQLNLDLPQEVLDEVSQLAQKFNVHRTDVLIRAVKALTRALELESEAERLKVQLAETAKEKESLGEWLKAQTAAVGKLAGERDALSRHSADLAEQTEILKRDNTELKVGIDRTGQELKVTIAERDAALKQSRELEEKDRQKVLSVMRDAEVEKLRKHAREIAMNVQELEKELAYQRMEADVMKKKLESLTRQTAFTLKLKKELEGKFIIQQKDTFKSDRQVGRLLQERAKLRGELNELVKLLHKGIGVPKAARPGGKFAVKRPQSTGRPGKRS